MKTKLAVQMYTIRDFTKTRVDLAESLKKIAAIGYKAVQVSAVGCLGGEVSAAEMRKMLDDNGLKCIATHRGLNGFLENVSGEIDFHHTLGCNYTAIGGLWGNEPYPQTLAGYRQFIADTKKFLPALKGAGIAFGFHNHSHEFLRPEPGQPRIYDIIIDEGGSDLMLEMDLFWVWHAGASPAQTIRRGKGRVSVIHLKDKGFYADEKNGCGIAPIGEGNMPWDEIIPVCEECGVEWYGIEHDYCARDPFDCLRSSFQYLSKFGLC